MKQIKKFAALFLVAALIFCLSSCSLANPGQTEITGDNIKIGVILKDTRDAKAGTSGICNNMIDGVTSLGFGISNERFKVSENVDPDDSAAVASAYKTLINFECNIIIASDPAYYDDTAKIADENPNIAFFVYGADKGNGKNIFAYGADINEVIYLEGIVAGLKANELGMPDIGYICDPETSVSAVNNFAQGAAVVNPNAKVSVRKVDDNIAASIEKLASLGCAVVASNVQSEDIAKTAADKDIFFCDFGTEAFNNEDYEKAFLCAPIYDFTQYFVDVIKTIIDYETPDNSQKGAVELSIEDGLIKDYAGSFASGAVYLSEININNAAPNTAQVVRDAINSAQWGNAAESDTMQAQVID